MVAGQRVAAAGVVDQRAGIIATWRKSERLSMPRRKASYHDIAFAGMVEDEVEDDADAFGMQGGDRVAQFLTPPGTRRGSSAIMATGL